MKNLLTSLKKLGKKMTGNDIAGTNLVTVVDDIANKYTGGSGGGGSGGGGGIFVIKSSDGGATLDSTWQEIHDAFAASMLCIYVGESSSIISTMIFQSVEIRNEHDYRVNASGGMYYFASSPDSYPGPAS